MAGDDWEETMEDKQAVNTEDLTHAELEQLFCVTEKDFQTRDHRLCDCPITFVRRKRHAALGRGIEIRLCCLARKVEELAGLPAGTFFLTLDFEPSWEWDCNTVQKCSERQPDGSVVETLRYLGPPPRWLRERMVAKGVPIHNLEGTNSDVTDPRTVRNPE